MPYVHHQYWPLIITCPAGRAASNPVSANYPMAQGTLHSIRIRIPAGHQGNTGVRVLYQGQQIMPWSNLFWLVDNDAVYTIPWEQEVMPYGITAQVYNTDRAPHSVWFYADLTPDLGAAPADLAGFAGLQTPAPGMLAAVGALHG